MAIELFPVDESLIPTFAPMVVAYYEDDPGHYPMTQDRAIQQVQLMLLHPTHVFPMMILSDSIPAGYLILVPYFSNEFGGPIIWLDEFCVLRAFRGQGIGSVVLELLRQLAVDRGWVRIELEVNHSNDGARRLYERHGFTMLDRHLMGLQVIEPKAQV